MWRALDVQERLIHLGTHYFIAWRGHTYRGTITNSILVQNEQGRTVLALK